MLTSDVPKPHAVLPGNASTIHPPRVLNQQTKSTQVKVEFIDFRIGLHLLGQEGRMLLAHYIRVKASKE